MEKETATTDSDSKSTSPITDEVSSEATTDSDGMEKETATTDSDSKSTSPITDEVSSEATTDSDGMEKETGTTDNSVTDTVTYTFGSTEPTEGPKGENMLF